MRIPPLCLHAQSHPPPHIRCQGTQQGAATHPRPLATVAVPAEPSSCAVWLKQEEKALKLPCAPGTVGKAAVVNGKGEDLSEHEGNREFLPASGTFKSP